MTPTSNTHDDGLGWLREVRRKFFADSGGDLKRLGNRYRQTQAADPGKVIDPRKMLAESIRAACAK